MIEILILLVLMLLNGIFSMSETAVVSLNKIRLENETKEGNKKAERALELANSPSKFLSTVQIGITLIGIVSGAFAGSKLTAKLSAIISKIDFLKSYSESISYVLIIFLITYLSTVIGEIVPKRIGMLNPERIAKIVAGPMQIISRISAPFVWLLTTTSEMIMKLFGIEEKEEEYNDEDVTAIIEKGAEKGSFQKVEHEVVESLFYLSDRPVGSLMKKRRDVVALDINNIDQIKSQISINPHFIFPVYENSPDNIIGIINTKNIASKVLQGEELNFKSLLDTPIYVHDKLEALKLLEEFRATEGDYAVVLDEFGQFQGIVTLRDIFIALVGSLNKNNESDDEIMPRDQNSWLIDGGIPFKKFLKSFNLSSKNIVMEKEFYTLAGFALNELGHIPHPGEKFRWQGFSFEIVDMDGMKIDKVMVGKLQMQEVKN